MYRDAAKCSLSPLYWGLIGLFTNHRTLHWQRACFWK